MPIDTSFDFRGDAAGGDPDATSPTLKRYHQLLWSKPLPIGPTFTLDAHTRFAYLHHSSHLGEFWLGSDAVMASFSNWLSAQHLIRQFPPREIEHFDAVGYTIGGMMIFPNNMIDRLHTLNQARGVTRQIADRMDLTLECIRRWYQGDHATPLSATIGRYADFFSLFRDFDGYVDFFLLQDLVDSSGMVRFFTAFEGFAPSGVPRTVDEYKRFRDSSISFIEARNRRIADWATEHLTREQAR
ncbi:hypothetical protein LKO27_02970 [Tessaracoccus sp. OS52]|uniref:DUF6994 family protein n=1 Tax=Tessaracoccus sp. OS52 TaxID=2886691 RepID=UPI001D1292E8|nr:hypothetical protein [Tessaracoccus sp. OS52]MCC2592387.1 hypothetical protein [Tessaracoccus sp. OS52]